MHKIPILVVEDNPEDFEAIRREFLDMGLGDRLHRCATGDDALDFLFRRGTYLLSKESPRPGLVLLDLNLPGTDGREVLETIKEDPGLRQIPVVILTTSCDEGDIAGCYEAGANSYLQKPVGLRRFREAVRQLVLYWLELVILPATAAYKGRSAG